MLERSNIIRGRVRKRGDSHFTSSSRLLTILVIQKKCRV